jgi:hypothetical protein
MATSQNHISQSTPMGANLVDGGATFRVWAPSATQVYVITDELPAARSGGWAPSPKDARPAIARALEGDLQQRLLRSLPESAGGRQRGWHSGGGPTDARLCTVGQPYHSRQQRSRSCALLTSVVPGWSNATEGPCREEPRTGPGKIPRPTSSLVTPIHSRRSMPAGPPESLNPHGPGARRWSGPAR